MRKKNLYIITIFLLLCSCTNNQKVYNRIFTEKEQQDIDCIMKYYDNHVVSYVEADLRTDISKKDINQMYKIFIDFAKKNDIRALTPTFRNMVFDEVDSVFLENIYEVKYNKSHQILEKNIAMDGKLKQLVDELAKDDKMVARYKKLVEKHSGYSQDFFKFMMDGYSEKIDFNDYQKRLLFVFFVMAM